MFIVYFLRSCYRWCALAEDLGSSQLVCRPSYSSWLPEAYSCLLWFVSRSSSDKHAERSLVRQQLLCLYACICPCFTSLDVALFISFSFLLPRDLIVLLFFLVYVFLAAAGVAVILLSCLLFLFYHSFFVCFLYHPRPLLFFSVLATKFCPNKICKDD